MKKIITLLALCTAFIACNNNKANNTNDPSAEEQTAAQESKTFDLVQKHSWADFNLQGKVKKITEYSYEMMIDDDGTVTQGAFIEAYEPITVKEFTPEGFLTRVTTYEEEGAAPALEYLYQYDAQNRLVAIKMKSSESKSTERYEYSPEGFISACITTFGDSESKITYSVTVTSEGKEVIEKSSGSYSPDAYTLKYYNTQNLLVKECSYDSENEKPHTVSTYTYNAKNQCEKIEQKGIEEATPPMITFFSYDEYGNITKVVFDAPAGIDYPDDHRESTSKYSYDEKGNIVKAIESNSENPLIKVCKIEYY